MKTALYILGIILTAVNFFFCGQQYQVYKDHAAKKNAFAASMENSYGWRPVLYPFLNPNSPLKTGHVLAQAGRTDGETEEVILKETSPMDVTVQVVRPHLGKENRRIRYGEYYYLPDPTNTKDKGGITIWASKSPDDHHPIFQIERQGNP